ncbi:MAG TPA: GWxTD domain-containing protein [Ignavibacteriaceae bacterium]|nr:GWxTD domain-containing protein [Ignavibacteriaceae bacterium]
MRKIIFLTALIIFFQTLDAQIPRMHPRETFKNIVPFFSEIHIIPGNGLNSFNFVYKLPYNQLFFVKNDDDYLAGMKLTVEVYDTSNNFIARQIKEDNVVVKKYSQTNVPLLFVEGVIKFNLPDGTYKFVPDLIDIHSNQDVKPTPLLAKKNGDVKTEFLVPMVLDDKTYQYENENYRMLANFNDSIPFGHREFELMIPVVDTTLTEIYITAVNNADTLYNGYLKASFISTLDIQNIKDHIILKTNGNTKRFRNFIFKNFVNKLDEGRLTITISKDKHSIYSENIAKDVVWFDKPFSLRNPEFAINSLKFMVNDSVITKLLGVDKLYYSRELTKFWRKYDPTPETKYNELMDEYYRRVDYAIRNFASIENRNGTNTDRGEIFIKYGNPDNIERSSDDYGRVIEKWIYESSNLSFLFIDKNGTGEFALFK